MNRIARLLGSAVFTAMFLAPHTMAAGTAAAPHAQAIGGAHVEIVDAGLHLSLSLPEQHYPANAIVQATMQVTNVTARAIRLGRTSFYDCRGMFAPQAVVMSHRTPVFPPIVVGTAFPSCPPPLPTGGTAMLRPGATLSSREYLLLRGPEIRAFVTIADRRSHSGLQLAPPVVATPILTVTLTASDAPTVTVEEGNAPVAYVARPRYARGRPFVGSGWSRLAKRGTVGKRGFVGILGFGNGWARQTSLTIRPKLMPGYTRFVEWHIVAGWLGHSAARVDFRQP